MAAKDYETKIEETDTDVVYTVRISKTYIEKCQDPLIKHQMSVNEGSCRSVFQPAVNNFFRRVGVNLEDRF